MCDSYYYTFKLLGKYFEACMAILQAAIIKTSFIGFFTLSILLITQI